MRVLAAGINNTDINTRIGWYAPDVTGETDDVDQDVEAGGWGGALAFPRIQGVTCADGSWRWGTAPMALPSISA